MWYHLSMKISMLSSMKMLSFFAGVGGIDLGFEKIGKTIWANEFDIHAAETFSLNFPDAVMDTRDVKDVKAEEVPDADILLAGFPCQAFSVAGYRQGFEDEKGRGNLFFELVRIMEVKKPRIVFLENVKNLVSHDGGNTFRVICGELERLGYRISYQVMNAMDFGDVPQNRERIYIVAFREKEDYAEFSMPLPIPLTKTIRDVVDFTSAQDEKFYYEGCGFYEILKSKMKRHDTTYQWRRVYVRENQSKVFPTLTANMGTGGHNVPLILTDDDRIRKITPRECFNVQGFPSSFKLPHQSLCHLYKQAGNSVVVPVIERIAENIGASLRI